MNLHPVVIPASITHSGARRTIEGWQEAAERYAREAGTHGLTPQQRAALMADAAAARVQAHKWAAKERFCRKG